MHPKFSSKLLSTAALVIASASFAQAASIIVNTVGVMNTNAVSVSEATVTFSNSPNQTGSAVTSTAFASNVATAFSNNTGGVWNFETAYSDVAVGDTITLKYGTSLANSFVMTLSGGNINRDTSTDIRPSGTGAMGLVTNGDTRTFTMTEGNYLLAIGLFNTDRGGSDRIPSLSVTFLDNTTASTSGANADFVFFHGIAGTALNPIKSFSISQNNLIRYDDLGFIAAPAAVPEPASAAALVGLAAVGFVALRRRRSKA